MRQRCASRLMSRLTHLEQQVRDMLIFARGETRLAEELSVDTLVQALASALEGLKLPAGVSVELSNQVSSAALMCNRDALVGACTNLVNNSVEAGATEIEVAVVSVEDEFVVRVSDNGPGFTREEAGQLLEAFYTTKSHGTGLGLAVVQAVVKAHQGRFAIDAPDTGGAVAIISLPLVRSLSTADRRQQPLKTD